MRHCNAHHIAAVLENKHEFYLFIRPQHLKPLAPQTDQLFDMSLRKFLERFGMLGRIQYYLALSVSGSDLEKVVCHIVWLGRCLRKRGEIIVVLQHLIIRHFSAARAERTPVLGHLGTILPVRGDHHPIVYQRIPSKLSHISDYSFHRNFVSAPAERLSPFRRHRRSIPLIPRPYPRKFPQLRPQPLPHSALRAQLDARAALRRT